MRMTLSCASSFLVLLGKFIYCVGMQLRMVTLVISLSVSFLGCCLAIIEQTNQQDQSPRWQKSLLHPTRGIVVVAHGLNLKPSAMDDLCTALNMRGFHTYRVSLTGHDTRHEDVFPASRWSEDFAASYRSAQSMDLTLPTYIVAFSAGGLVATHFLDSMPAEVKPPHKMVLLAPALALRLLPRSAYLLTWVWPLKLAVRNLAPESYRRLDYTPLFWYRNTIELYDETRELAHVDRLQKIPTLILLSRDDELISRTILSEWLEHNHLVKTWRVEQVRPEPKTGNLYQHLIIDENSLGETQWRDTTARIAAFLREPEY